MKKVKDETGSTMIRKQVANRKESKVTLDENIE